MLKEMHEFSAEVEREQAEVMIQLLQKLQTGSTESLSANTSVQLTQKLLSLLHEYRRGLADKVWLSNRQGKLEDLSETLESGISAIHEDLEVKDLQLQSLAEKLEKALQGGRHGRHGAPSSQAGSASSDAKSASGCGCKSGGTCGGCKKKKPDGCGGCSSSGCGKSAPPDIKKLLMDCYTSEQRWTLRNKLIELEINTLMAQNPNLYSIPESRKAEIRKRVEAAMEKASAELHNDMIAPGGGRVSNQSGTLVVSKDGSLRISAADDKSESD
jgi:hypothetical protein